MTIALDARSEEQPELVRKALHRAWNLGQDYWRQADSESYKQHALSDKTREKFEQLSAETLAALREPNSGSIDPASGLRPAVSVGTDRASEWIAVSERLPEKRNRCVLAYCPDSCCTFTAYIDEEDAWRLFGSWANQRLGTVSHWTPLHAAPSIESASGATQVVASGAADNDSRRSNVLNESAPLALLREARDVLRRLADVYDAMDNSPRGPTRITADALLARIDAHLLPRSEKG